MHFVHQSIYLELTQVSDYTWRWTAVSTHSLPSVLTYTHVPKNLQPGVKRFFSLSVLHRTPSVSEQGINQSASTDLSSTTKSNSLAGWRPLRCVGTSKCLFSRKFSIIFQSVLITSRLSTCTLFFNFLISAACLVVVATFPIPPQFSKITKQTNKQTQKKQL